MYLHVTVIVSLQYLIKRKQHKNSQLLPAVCSVQSVEPVFCNFGRKLLNVPLFRFLKKLL